MWDSSNSSSWVLRAMRRAKLGAVPGSPPVMAASNGCTSTVSAPPTPAANAASVVRSMFTHGSRWAIMGAEVTACTVAAPAPGFTDDLGDAGPQLAGGPELGDRHELVVVGREAETRSGQRIDAETPLSPSKRR